MGFRFYRRINLGDGVGLNVSKSGVGASLRGKYGSIGSRGFSIRTGIPGLTFRKSWGGGGQYAWVAALAFALIVLGVTLLYIALQIAVFLLILAWHGARWCCLTAQDYLEYRRTGRQALPTAALAEAEAEGGANPNGDQTLAEIIEGSRRGDEELNRPSVLARLPAPSRREQGAYVGADSDGARR